MLFENMSILIVGSDQSSDALKALLLKNGAESVTFADSKESQQLSNIAQYTHVISDSVEFVMFPEFEKLMVPIVTPKWIHTCVSAQKLVSLRPFTPDPNKFLKKIVVTVSSSVSRGDKDFINEAVRAFGGQFSDQLLLNTTHLVSLDPADDLSCVARECNATGESDIKIVTRDWIGSCLAQLAQVSENGFFLDDSDVSVDISLAIKSDFLSGHKLYIGQDLQLSSNLKNTVDHMIKLMKGESVYNIDEANVYLGKYRSGEEYIHLSRQGVIVGNMNWFLCMVSNLKWSVPTTNLLHYPIVQGGLPGFDKFVVGVTNYTGDGRYWLEMLVRSLGGEFTKNLKTTNTHLICAKPVGKKYEAGVQWARTHGMKIVNHLWIEEIYQRWKLLSEDDTRYGRFPKDLSVSERLGSTSLDELVLKCFYRDTDDEASVADSLDIHEANENSLVNNDSDMKVFSFQEDNEDKENVSVEANKAETVQSEPSTKEEDEKENIPVSETKKRHLDSQDTTPQLSHKRSAKVKLAMKLHSDMEDLNFFQKQHSTVPKLPSELKKKKKSDSSLDYQMKVIITGCEDEFELNDSNVEVLRKCGIDVITEFDDLDAEKKKIVLVAPRILRTEKFLTSLSFKLHDILIPDFLNQVVKCYQEDNSEPIDLKQYQLKNYLNYSDIRLKEIWAKPEVGKIESLIENEDSVFSDTQFVIWTSLLDLSKNEAYSRIISRHGCSRCEIVYKKEEVDRLVKEDKSIKVLTKKKLGKHYNVVDYDWIVKKIMLEIR